MTRGSRIDRVPKYVCLLLSALWGLSCRPDFEDRPSLVTSPHIIAVEADAAEVRPGRQVALHAVLAGAGEGKNVDSGFSFAFCTTPRPFGIPSNVNVDCFEGASTPIPGGDSTVTATVPTDACRLFGPDPPPGDFRPADPDDTGGFYQPVLVAWRGTATVFPLRLLCSLPDASQEVSARLAAEYTANQRPASPTVTLSSGIVDNESSLEFGAESASIALEWDSAVAEEYLWYNPGTLSLEERKEGLRLSLFSTQGDISPATVSIQEGNAQHSATFSWSELPRGKHGTLWIVFSDSRGGMTVWLR